MRVEDLGLGEEFEKRVKEKGVGRLYPPQEEAVKKGVMEDGNMVVASPTASGKTLIGILFAYSVLKTGRRVVYLTPLKALAEEKLAEVKSYLEGLRVLGRSVRVGISTGDYDSPGDDLGSYDVIILTNEKFDSLLRHGASWVEKLGGVIADEVHLIGDPARGPVLEYVLSVARRMNLRILALSATITNSRELAKWLSASLVESSWRPVPLREGVYLGGCIHFVDGGVREVEAGFGDPVLDLVYDTIKDDGQALVFTDTRRSSVAIARMIAKSLPTTSLRTRKDVSKLVKEASKTSLEDELSVIVAKGVGFHHAGLSLAVRQVIEEAFRSRNLKVLVSTTTLAAGVNLPARRVVVSTLRRYDSSSGRRVLIPVFEYKQMAGRAGRPGFDEVGEAVVIAKTDHEASFYKSNYLSGEPEPILSSLGGEDRLESFVLALLSSQNKEMSGDEVTSFFRSTLWGYQFRGLVRPRVKESIKRLEEMGAVSRTPTGYRVTGIGALISRLYIRPSTAQAFLSLVREKVRVGQEVLFMLVASTTTDFEPRYPARSSDIEVVLDQCPVLSELLEEDAVSQVVERSIESSGRSLSALFMWVNEAREGDVYEKTGVEPGDLYRMVESMSWILYSYSRIAGMLKRNELETSLRELSLRVRYGVKRELLELVLLSNVGRTRARALYNSGFKSLADLARADPADISKVPGIGGRLSEAIVNEARELVGSG